MHLSKIIELLIPISPLEIQTKYGLFKIDQKIIRERFLDEYVYFPINERIERIIKWSEKLLIKFIDEIQDTTQDKEAIQKDLNGQVKKYFINFKPIKAVDVYCNLFSEKYLFATVFKNLTDEDLGALNEQGKLLKDSKKIQYEDLAGLLYIHKQLYGKVGSNQSNNKFHYTVIDEAQDISPFQISLIDSITEHGAILIIGDLGQSIYNYCSINKWSDVDGVFSAAQRYIELSISYRSTVEIMNFANQIIKPITLGKYTPSQPIHRRGPVPKIIKCDDQSALINSIETLVVDLNQKGFYSIGIICRTKAETEVLGELMLTKLNSLHVIRNDREVNLGGTVVIPSYLSKGIEFDAVILPQVSLFRFAKSELDRKLLYISTSRALHELYLLCSPVIMSNDKNEFLNGKELYSEFIDDIHNEGLIGLTTIT